MKIKHNNWKIITAFIATIVAALFPSESSTALSVENKVLSGLTIEERLAKVREQIQQNENQIPSNSDKLSSSSLSSESKESYLISQWDDWSDWCDRRSCDDDD